MEYMYCYDDKRKKLHDELFTHLFCILSCTRERKGFVQNLRCIVV